MYLYIYSHHRPFETGKQRGYKDIYIYVYIHIYLYLYIYTYIIGPPVYQCGEHWSGGPGSLVRGAKEKLSIPAIGC